MVVEYRDSEGLKRVEVKNCTRPSMRSGYGGRTWDIIGELKINESKITLHADTTWGTKAYFCINQKWYSLDLIEAEKLDRKEVRIVRNRKKE